MKKVLFFLLLLSILLVPSVHAQVNIELNPLTNYQAKGTARVAPDTTRYRITAKIENLPDAIPNSGKYYVLWATIQDGRADNLGTITNNQEISATVAGTPRQVFITAEKERFPEYVQGPRISQTREITASELGPLSSPTPSPSRSPGVGGGGTGPVGQPTDAPETGLGGSYVFYTITAAMITFGTFGALMSLRKSTAR